VKILIILLTLLYPLFVFWGLGIFSIREVSITLLAFFFLRLLLTKKEQLKNNKATNKIKEKTSPLSSGYIVFPVILLFLFSFIFENHIGVLFYPVVINSSLALIFLYSLYNPPPVIEKLARLKTPDLPEKAIKYTRTVTKVWLVFFILNATIAAYTALYTSLATWTLYNGLLSYIGIGILFGIEYIVRLRVQKSDEN
jgi:uncharacterized membrane protein